MSNNVPISPRDEYGSDEYHLSASTLNASANNIARNHVVSIDLLSDSEKSSTPNSFHILFLYFKWINAFEIKPQYETFS